MPEGYYSGDKPNPNLRRFAEEHLRERPYDPGKDTYDVPAFDKAIETTKVTAIYNMHTYWAKKPHDAIRQYIRHYTQPGDLVLDPFCGSGGTALAALMEGRKAIAIDRSPAATFITKNYCTPVDVEELRRVFEELKAKVKPEIEWLYETHCDWCGGAAVIHATVFSAVFICQRCLSPVPLFHARPQRSGYNKVRHYCPHCQDRGIEEEISLRGQRRETVPVRINYRCPRDGCKGAKGERDIPYPRDEASLPDLLHLVDIEESPIKGRVPDTPMMNTESGRWGLLQRPYHGKIRSVADFYSPRNLRAMSLIASAVRETYSGDIRDELLFAVEAISMNMSMLQGYSENPRFPNNMMKGTLYTPPIWREYNVLDWLEGKMRNLEAGYRAIQQERVGTEVEISTQSATNLAQIPDSSIDFVFTDPPYSYKVQFGELNFIWESWLGFASDWKDEEIIVNEVRGKTGNDWATGIKSAMAECYRVLKPGRWISVCYHDSSEGTWAVLQDIMAETGFILSGSGETATYIDTDRKSWKQLVSQKVTKRDLVINLRKPRPGEVVSTVAFTGSEDVTTFREKVHTVIREHLADHPGAPKDRIYDQVVSRMVRAGAMEPHDFEELLRQVAVEVKLPVKKDLFQNEDPNLWGTHEVARWYLKETELAVRDEAESAKEDHAAANLAAFMRKFLKEHPEEEGVHYSDLFERYVYGVKDKPRRELAEFLPDYFYKTEEGTWRSAANEDEEQVKADGRTKGTGRRIKRYLAMLAEGIEIPEGERSSDATLAEWVRHCKRSGMYGQGKELYERGGLRVEALPEEVQVAVEEDYQVCMRLLLK